MAGTLPLFPHVKGGQAIALRIGDERSVGEMLSSPTSG